MFYHNAAILTLPVLGPGVLCIVTNWGFPFIFKIMFLLFKYIGHM